MPAWQEPMDRWFREHHGVAPLAALLDMGVSYRTVQRMVQRGELDTMLPGVYRTRQWPRGTHQQMAAACARNPAALVAFTSALTEWKVRGTPDTGVHVLVPHGVTPEMDGIIVHRCRRIDRVDIVERSDGIRLTSPPRSLFDSADILGFKATRSALEQLLNERVCTLGTFNDTFARLAHPNRPGTRTTTLVLRSRPVWLRALQSDLEQRVFDEITAQGLPVPIAQCPVELPNGRTIHLDFGWREWKVGLEVDDPAWHAGFEDRHRDMQRDRKAATVGWIVPRVSKIDVDHGLRDAISDVRTIVDLRRAG
jgi:very-short-patch-repair endonuclease